MGQGQELRTFLSFCSRLKPLTSDGSRSSVILWSFQGLEVERTIVLRRRHWWESSFTCCPFPWSPVKEDRLPCPAPTSLWSVLCFKSLLLGAPAQSKPRDPLSIFLQLPLGSGVGWSG